MYSDVQKTLASLEHEVVRGRDLCPTCSAAGFGNVNDLGVANVDKGELYNDEPYFKRMSTDILRCYQYCWFCRLLCRFYAQLLPDDLYVRWRTEDVLVALRRSDGIWKAQLLIVGSTEASELAFWVRADELGPMYSFYLTCYLRDDPPSRRTGILLSSTIQDTAYAQTIRSWTSFCESEHSGCGIATDLTSSLGVGLDLIDVNTRRIVTMTGRCRYVALSFVWGENPLDKKLHGAGHDATMREIIRDAQKTRQLPLGTPATVEDAISVTRSLEEAYLWVDCFCIEQDDPVLKQSAIEKMDAIYSGAFLTICVLDGGNVFAGIPGVSQPHHGRRQAMTDTGNERYLVTHLAYLSSTLGNSSWASRAWTFQEGALSTRRLCFSTQGVSLLCKEEAFHDIMEFDESKSRSRTPFDAGTDYGLALTIHLHIGKWDFETYSRLATSYSRRKLTFRSDALNAITGGLRMISRNTGMDFISAIPVKDLSNGLLWFHPRPNTLNGPYAEMYETYDAIGHRRPEFPSWSWLEWEGPVKYGYWLEISGSSDSPTQIPMEDSNVFSLNDGGRILYRDTIRIRSSALASFDSVSTHGSLAVLVLETKTVFLKVARIAASGDLRDKNGDYWLVFDVYGRPIVLDRSDTFYDDVLVNFYFDASTSETKCSVNLHCCTSGRLLQERTEMLEFVLLQHWTQNPTSSKPRHIHKESWAPQAHD